MKDAFAALAKAQAAMGKALKKSQNPHFRSAYADLGSVQDACMDALHANGFAVFQPTGQDEFGLFVKTVFAHESGEVLECRTPLLIDKNNMQGLGSAITYARRYGLLCMSGLAPEDDDGNATVAQTTKADEERAAKVQRLIDDARASLMACDSIEGLRETWVQVQGMFSKIGVPTEVVAAKDEAKKALETA